MTKQIAFIIFMAVALGIFAFTVKRLYSFFKLTKEDFTVDRINERIAITLKVAFGQTKIMRFPIVGIIHALVWWGFLVVTVGTAEMVIDGLAGTERILAPLLGPVYTVLFASGDIFALIIVVSIIIFLARRFSGRIKRFYGVEMKPKSKVDATIALFMILFLMLSLLGMNAGYAALYGAEGFGYYPVANVIVPWLSSQSAHFQEVFYEVNWWTHIVLVFVFLNGLPYSKHFHVIMSVPNVFFTNLDPLTKLKNMDSVTKEVELMMNPETAYAPPPENAPEPERFGIKDVQDVSWKNYMDSLTCTECGRCTSVCPANITGKLLSPRKILVDTRRRMNDVGPGKAKDPSFEDGKLLVGPDYITEEELWACTTCNACVQECPVDIDHVSLIVGMRRALVMEDAKAPASLNMMFTNIENNGAPWQFSPEDRFNWAENIELNVN